MKIPFVDLNEQYRSIKPEIDQAIQAVLDSSSYVSGPFVANFEKNLAKKHDAKYCAGVSSGTSALHVAMWALGIKAGDEVIVPSHTFIASASTISLTGATPVFVECENAYYNLDPNQIENAITDKTKAILVVHLYGQPVELEKIKNIADKHKLLLIEDCAQAHLATFKGKTVGTFGVCGCFSFYPGKNLGAYGEGGAVITNDPELHKKILMLREHGSEKKYYHPIIGNNYRMQGMQGAILDVKLKHLDKWTEQRRKNAVLYNKYLKDVKEIILPKEMDGAKHVYHLYVIRTKKRDELIEFLTNSGISVGIHYPIPCHLQECYKQLNYKKGALPITEAIASEIVSLPMYPELSEEQIRYTSNKIKEFFHASN